MCEVSLKWLMGLAACFSYCMSLIKPSAPSDDLNNIGCICPFNHDCWGIRSEARCITDNVLKESHQITTIVHTDTII